MGINISKRAATLHSLSLLLLRQPKSFQMLWNVKREKLTFLGPGALADLALSVDRVERELIPGLLIETGCALGGSAILIAVTKQANRPLMIYDTFEMIPPPDQQDGSEAHQRYKVIKAGQAKGFGNDTYYGYQENLYDRVRASFSNAGCPIEQNQIQMIKGLIENTLQIDQPVALAHIDCDWYSPVMASLERIAPCLSTGGRLIIDDYYQWSGAKKAVDEYFSDKKGRYLFLHKSRLHIVRISL